MAPESLIVDRVNRTLERIAADTNNTFISVDADAARLAAQQSDERRAVSAPLGPFDGEIIAVKDNLDTKALRTTFGSAVYADRVPDSDAEVVAMLRSQGAIIIGKTHMTEMTCGTTGTNAWCGDAHNPHDSERYAGGSSSGSAVAVASGLTRYALGSDTSCSIRQPAAVCGVVGLKPTFGRVSTVGLGVGYQSMDHVGPMAASVSDCAALLDAISSGPWQPAAAFLDAPVSSLRVGILGGQFIEHCEHDARRAFKEAALSIEALGCVVGDVELDLDLAAVDEHVNAFGRDLARAHAADFVGVDPTKVSSNFRYWLNRFNQITNAEYDTATATQRAISAKNGRGDARLGSAHLSYNACWCRGSSQTLRPRIA